jgi:xanthine/CO dehydrogenase XdhC/CoxF family maturation factor
MDDEPSDRVRPYGLGCGGVVHLLLERRATADAFLREAQRAFSLRAELACAVVLEGAQIGQRAFASSFEERKPAADKKLGTLAVVALRDKECSTRAVGRAWAEYIPPRCGLFIFGAGDDVQPLVVQASTLGWQITVADGRAHLATQARFPGAQNVVVLKDGDLSQLELQPSDAAVVMTHSFDQDSKLLTQLLPMPLVYRGVLGPRYRTVDLVQHAVERIGGTVAEWMQKLYAPVGFDLGADSPATIALSILAEIQSTLRLNRGGCNGVAVEAGVLKRPVG